MHPSQAASIARKKTMLAAGFALFAALFAVAPAQAQTKDGKEPWKSHLSADAPEMIYRQHCAACHGEKGDGQTPARLAIDPPPKDFTADKTRKEASRAHMIEVLNKGARTKDGKPTAMISWKDHFSREQIEAVVDYIIVNFMEGKIVPNSQLGTDQHKHAGHDHGNVQDVDYPYGLKPNASKGKSIYSASCASCHGANGEGKGAAAPKGSQLRSFKDAAFAESATGFRLYSLVSRGPGHTPAWDKKLSKQDIADVSEYVLKTFSKPEEDHSQHQHEHHHK